jgi:hypothetical protein
MDAQLRKSLWMLLLARAGDRYCNSTSTATPTRAGCSRPGKTPGIWLRKRHLNVTTVINIYGKSSRRTTSSRTCGGVSRAIRWESRATKAIEGRFATD